MRSAVAPCDLFFGNHNAKRTDYKMERMDCSSETHGTADGDLAASCVRRTDMAKRISFYDEQVDPEVGQAASIS